MSHYFRLEWNEGAALHLVSLTGGVLNVTAEAWHRDFLARATALGFEVILSMRFDAGPGIRSEADIATLITFFRARRGAARAFRFRDPFDSGSGSAVPTPLDQTLALGDGAATSFPLIKRYGEGDEAQVRRITRPVAGSVRVAVGGTEASGWSLLADGIVSLVTPPAAGAEVTAGYLFDVPVRFAEDTLEVSRTTFLAGEAPNVPLIEVRGS